VCVCVCVFVWMHTRVCPWTVSSYEKLARTSCTVRVHLCVYNRVCAVQRVVKMYALICVCIIVYVQCQRALKIFAYICLCVCKCVCTVSKSCEEV